MKKRKIILITISIATVILLILFAKLFLIGFKETQLYQSVTITHHSYDNKTIKIQGGSINHKKAFKEYKYYTVGRKLFIEVYYVYPSVFYNNSTFDILINGDFGKIDYIYFTDGKNDKLILR